MKLIDFNYIITFRLLMTFNDDINDIERFPVLFELIIITFRLDSNDIND